MKLEPRELPKKELSDRELMVHMHVRFELAYSEIIDHLIDIEKQLKKLKKKGTKSL